MKFYGINSQGIITIQVVASLPVWAASDEGRIIYVNDINRIFYGGQSSWIPWGDNFLVNQIFT